jgi:hypothetical protein
MRPFVATLILLTVAACDLVDDPVMPDCYTYAEAVADASGVVGEWALGVVVTTGFGTGPECHSPEDFDLAEQLFFGPEGEFVRWSDGAIDYEGSFAIEGGRVAAGGRQYTLREDGWLVRDLSPIDGPVYVYGRIQQDSPAD